MNTNQNSLKARYARKVLSLKYLVILLCLLITGALGYGMGNLSFNNSYRVFFGKDNAQLAKFDELQRVYSKTDNIVYAISPKEGTVFNKNTLALVKELTEASWQLPHSTRVDSITNYQHTEAVGDDLTVADMVEGEAANLTPTQLEKIEDVIMNEPTLMSRLISPNGEYTGVYITFNLPDITEENKKDHAFIVPALAQQSRKLVEEIGAKYPDHTIAQSGIVMMNNAFAEESQKDVKTLVMYMYITLLFMMFVFLRSFFSMLSGMVLILLSVVSTMGAFGWLGFQLNAVSISAPTVILTLAIADSIHIITTMFKEMGKGSSKREAIVESIRINLQPVFLTSLTTAIGFLTLNFSDSPPFGDLGNMTAFGVMMAFFFSVTLLPCLLDILPIRKPSNMDAKSNHRMGIFANFIIRFRIIIFIVSICVVSFLAYQVPKLQLNDEFVKYFDKSVDFRNDTDIMVDNLTGIYMIEYSVPARGPQGITSPEYLRYLEDFANWLRQKDEVMSVYTMTDIFKRLNKNMHGDKQLHYRLPDKQDLAAQYLLLYEMSLPYGLDINDRINIDKSSTRLTAMVDDISMVEFRQLNREAKEWLNNGPSYMKTDGTSPTVMFANISKRNIESMMQGNIVALVLISLIIVLALRSIKIGVFSLVPNLVPALMGFGVWYLLIGQVNMAVASVTSLSLGIIVDDTVHFLSKYLRARREHGYNPKEAVEYAFKMVGSALLVTTLVIIIGFSILILSSFQINEYTGMLTAIIIFCALVADFFLLPTLLLIFDKKDNSKTNV